MMSVLVLVLYLLSVCNCTNSSCKDTCEFVIDQSSGRCKPTCIQEHEVPCCSIEHVARVCGTNVSNITLAISGNISVTEAVIFENISYLSIIRNSVDLEPPILNCTPLANSLPGFKFVNVVSLQISDVKIANCGASHFFVNNTVITVGVTVTNSSTVSLVNVRIAHSIGTSLLIENTFGKVFMDNVIVENNRLCSNSSNRGKSFAGGAFFLFNSSWTNHNDHNVSDYTITNSVFKSITTPNSRSYHTHFINNTIEWFHSIGGGLLIIFDGDSSQINISIGNCTFKHMKAPWGAGMYVRFQKNVRYNSVHVADSTFYNCTATIGCGGIDIGSAKRSPSLNNNIVFVKNSVFRKNNATMFGGGTCVFAYPSDFARKEKFVTFHNCSWIDNTARYSPAVDISPARFDRFNYGEALPLIPIFRDCIFERNIIQWKEQYKTRYITSGVFVITSFTVKFIGRVYFDGNAYTALLLNSGKVTLEENTQLQFVNNTGLQGGAVALHGFSYISVSDNCRVEFINNRATEYGGAIFYYPIEQREFFGGRVCFLRYKGDYNSPVDGRNISFVFFNNFAGVNGSSIYSTSLYACYFFYRNTLRGQSLIEFIYEIGNFSFTNDIAELNDRAEWATTGYRFKYTGTGKQMPKTLPGMKLSLPLKVMDELHQTVKSVFFIQVSDSNTSISVSNPYTANGSVVLLGTPNRTTNLVISTQHTYRSIQYTMKVFLSPCPPGYFYDNSTGTCQCSSSKELRAYIGIVTCNYDNFTAIIKRGYWAGYYNSELFTAPCPFQFCVNNNNTRVEHLLPNSAKALSSEMCGAIREGLLCGQCKEGYSIYYHSKDFNCGQNDKCDYGIVLFILSEILPVLIFFTIVVIFDISFSSGSRNGFIFYSQVVTILPMDYITAAQHPASKYLQIGYNLIYGVFNIEFFTIESLSFCLFKNATVMDTLAFRYITVIFAFALVVMLTVLMRYCKCCDKLCANTKKNVTTKESVLHGLSAFLIICYMESARVSFFILSRNTLRGAGGASGPDVALYSGDAYFEGKHLLYGIPAIIILIVIAILPPMLLLLYPNSLKLLQLCKLSEHRLVLAILKVTRINLLLPWLDVFQGHFKDNLRFFAGLYFFYRLALLIPFSFCENYYEYAVTAELVIVLMLSFHSVAQPYQQKKHNIIDSLLFSNLALINGLSAVMIVISQNAATSQFLLGAIIYFQILLIYLPMLVCGSFLILKFCKYIQKKFRRSTREDNQELLDYLEYQDDSRDKDDENTTQELEEFYDTPLEDDYN